VPTAGDARRRPGFVALIQRGSVSFSAERSTTILERTTTDLGVPNYDTTFGWGLVDAQAALAATPAP